ncbi:hypothetical protein [Psychrobacter sp. LV10R520-6]|uniref:hypothetical protein n=1 Tax=Psychrobacter sp. LV10R520-6 TaxID=1415574 RepID=UPI0024C8D498|nr:hypothetical protein [Psychrobacter sp. LV10R520-6]SNT71050.1 hypothetical protein SAMN04488491_2270 [Psychrobacter sp. LV10R520-6]
MKFILLAISLLIASNGYAEINDNHYIYINDNDEEKSNKEELATLKNETARLNLKNLQESRKKKPLTHDKSEVVFKVGDASKRDVGAKIGMTQNQVLDKTYWGKPDITRAITDEYGKLDLWSYDYHGFLLFDNDKLIKILTVGNARHW